MDWLTFGLTQKCTVWRKAGVDAYNKPSFTQGEVLQCRWEDVSEKVQTDEGKEVSSKSRVFLAVDVDTGDYLAQGEHTGDNPLRTPGASRVMAWRKTPSLDGASHERKAYL